MFQLTAERSLVETGIPWCPAIPGRWSLVRNKNVMSRRSQIVGDAFENFDLLSLTKSGVVRRDLSTGKGKIPASFETYQVVDEGDMVMCLFDVDETPRTVGRARFGGMITGAYDRFVVSDATTAEYLTWFYLAVDNVKGLRALYRGLRKTVPADEFLAANVPLPPADEQAAIVKYLAHANARIDRAIAAKRRLIALLNEADSAIANDVFGLSGPVGEESVPWLGKVPSTWDVRPAKRLFREVDTRSSDGAEGLLSLRMREGLVDANAYAAVPVPPSSLVGYKIVQPGEMVMNRMRAAIGLFGVATVRGLVSPDYSILRPTDGVDPDFYLLLFKTQRATAEFRRRSTGLGTGSSGFLRLYYEQFGPMPMPVPPLPEQRRIVDRVRSERAPLAQASARTQTEIDLIEEFRRRLVSDVVTGRVDVRGIAASLPDIAPEVAWGRSDLAEPPDPAELDDVIVDSEP